MPLPHCGPTIGQAMIDEFRVREVLEPFGLQLTDRQVGQVLTYLSLLMRWNSKINLTSVRKPEDCVTRHFGESLYLARFVSLEGRAVDIGSGAGFPGLALKIAYPELVTTLLEPVGKKRAFLKEVMRALGLKDVEVLADRLEEHVHRTLAAPADCATCRAVGGLSGLVPLAGQCVKPGGRLFFWIGSDQQEEISQAIAVPSDCAVRRIEWKRLAQIPLSQNREIWCGNVLFSSQD